MHNQGTAAAQQPEASSPPRPEYAAVLQELRAGIAEAERRIDRLMVMRRRELAGIRAAQSGPVPAAPIISGPQPAAGPDSPPTAESRREPEAEAAL